MNKLDTDNGCYYAVVLVGKSLLLMLFVVVQPTTVQLSFKKFFASNHCEDLNPPSRNDDSRLTSCRSHNSKCHFVEFFTLVGHLYIDPQLRISCYS